MESAGLPSFEMLVTDQYGGEMLCKFDVAPFLKAFASLYQSTPPVSPEQIEAAIKEMAEQPGVTKELAEAAAKREIARQDGMVAAGLLYFLETHLRSAIEESLNTAEKGIEALALDITQNVKVGLKKHINELLDKQRKLAQSRLGAGRGKQSTNPFRLLGDLFQAMRLVTAAGNEITQDNVAAQMSYEHIRTFQKQLDSHGIEWSKVVNAYRDATRPN